jgi:small-conductance mechanosensitive channel
MRCRKQLSRASSPARKLSFQIKSVFHHQTASQGNIDAGGSIQNGPGMSGTAMHSTFAKFWDAGRHMIDTFISRVPALLLAAIVFLVFCFLSGIVARAIRRTVSDRRQNLALVFSRLTAGLTILLGLLVSTSIVAPSFQASDLIKILGIGGVAIGFAFQNILQNFLAGLLLLWAEPFRVGDEIKLDAFEGRVEEIQARATIIETYDKRRVVIPNADLFTHSVIVNTALGSRRWQYDLSVKKIAPLDELKRAILQAVEEAPGVMSDPAPEVLVGDVTPDAVKMRILWSTHDSRQHQMLASYDLVLTRAVEAVESFEDEQAQRPAA